MSQRKYHCTRCNELLHKSNIESNNARIIAYCVNPKHRPIRFQIWLGSGRKTIRKERLIINNEIDPEFNLKKLNCICGAKFYPDRVGVSHQKGIKNGMCLAQSHRVQLTVTSKLYPNEPRFYELQEIITKPIKQ